MKIFKELDSVTNKNGDIFYVGDGFEYSMDYKFKTWNIVGKIIKIEEIPYSKGDHSRGNWFCMRDHNVVELTVQQYGFPYTYDGELLFLGSDSLDNPKFKKASKDTLNALIDGNYNDLPKESQDKMIESSNKEIVQEAIKLTIQQNNQQ